MTLDLSWPASLPTASLPGYGIDDDPKTVRTDMEAGSARQRQTSTQASGKLTVQWDFDLFEYAIFEAWLRHRARYGGSWFSMAYLAGTGVVEAEVRFQKGRAPAKWSNGQRVMVTADLDVRDRPMLSDDELTLVMDEDPSALFAAVDALHLTLETEFPTA